LLAKAAFVRRRRERVLSGLKQRADHDTVRLMERHLKDLAEMRERWSTILTLQAETRRRYAAMEAAARKVAESRVIEWRIDTTGNYYLGRREEGSWRVLASNPQRSSGRSKPTKGNERGSKKEARPVVDGPSSASSSTPPQPKKKPAPVPKKVHESTQVLEEPRYCRAHLQYTLQVQMCKSAKKVCPRFEGDPGSMYWKHARKMDKMMGRK
jgi:hypothetical protein